MAHMTPHLARNLGFEESSPDAMPCTLEKKEGEPQERAGPLSAGRPHHGQERLSGNLSKTITRI